MNVQNDPASRQQQQQQQQQQQANQLSASSMGSMMMMNQQHPMRAPPHQDHQQHLQNLMMMHGQVVQPPMESILQQQLMMPPPVAGPEDPQQQQQQQFGTNPFGQFPFSTSSAFASAIAGGDVPTASHEALIAAIQQQQQHQQQQQSQQRHPFQQRQNPQHQHQQQNPAYTEMLFNAYGEGGQIQSQQQQQPSGGLGAGYNIQQHLGHGSSSLPSEQQSQQLSGGMFGGGFLQTEPHFSAASSHSQQQLPEGLVTDRRPLHQEQFLHYSPQSQLQQQAQLISRAGFLNLQHQQQQELLQSHLFQRRRSSLGSAASDMSPLNPVGLPIQRPSLASESAPGFTSLESFAQAHQSPRLQATLPQQLSLFQPTNEYHANFPQPSEPSMFTSFFRAGGGIPSESILAQSSSTTGDRVVVRTKRAKSFPEKLMEALIRYGDEEVVAWLPDGKSFVVVKPDEFVTLVLNPIFKQAKYTSFVRKLHRWGFVRLTSGTGTDCFHHPLFNRNRRDLASKITVAAGTQKSKPEKVPPSLAGVERFAQMKKVAVTDLAQTAVTEKVKELEHDEANRPPPSSDLGDSKPAAASTLSFLSPTMDARLDKLGTVAAGYNADPTIVPRGLLSGGHGGLLGSPVSAYLSEKKSDDSGNSPTDVSPSQTFKVERAEI